MEKSCINCKWYYNHKCNNNELQITKDDTTYWKIVNYIESGILSEQLKEAINLNELGKEFLKVFIDLGYIKKNCINKALNEKYEDNEANIYENIEYLFATLLMQYFKNNGQHIEKVNINDPYNFYCCKWE